MFVCSTIVSTMSIVNNISETSSSMGTAVMPLKKMVRKHVLEAVILPSSGRNSVHRVSSCFSDSEAAGALPCCLRLTSRLAELLHHCDSTPESEFIKSFRICSCIKAPTHIAGLPIIAVLLRVISGVAVKGLKSSALAQWRGVHFWIIDVLRWRSVFLAKGHTFEGQW